MKDFLPTINHIVCTDKVGLIGKDNSLIWDIPEELKYFKEITKNNIILMGKETFISLNSKPLPNRINIVISTTLDKKESDNLYIINTLDEALVLADYLGQKDHKDIFIIGGESIYNQTYMYIDKLYLTKLDFNFKHSPQLGKVSNKLFYYKFDKFFKEEDLNLIDRRNIHSTRFIPKISAYVFEVSHGKLE